MSLTEVVDYLARQLKINYIMEKGISGTVTLNTYGEAKDIEPRALLDTVLRINGAAMVEGSNGIYRIVPLAELGKMPMKPEIDPKSIPDDDRAMLNLVFLKYANVDELSKLISEFLGPNGKAWSYPPANLLLVIDSRRSMRRTMELIAMFDSDVMAKERVRLFPVKNSRPSDLSKELEGLLKSMSLSKELASVKFVPVDRINTLIAVAPNPGVYERIEEWIKKLDVKVKGASGKIDTYVYRVKYSEAKKLATSIMSLYMMAYGGYGMGGYGMGGYGMGGYGMGGYGMGGYGMGGYGMGGYGMGGYGMAGTGMSQSGSGNTLTGMASAGSAQAMQQAMGADQTGSYMGMGMGTGYGMMMRGPRVVANESDNSLLILATPEEYESVLKLIEQLDISPRQVLVEAKIYEVTLTGSLSWGLEYYLQNRASSSSHSVYAKVSSTTLGLSTGWVVNHAKELMATLSMGEVATRTKVISTPSVIATDSIAASITVGTQIPTLTSTATSSATVGGDSLYASTISYKQTGVTLSFTARVNPTGIVTMTINQDVSSPGATTYGVTSSASISNRNISTQITLQDGDTVAIGGIISETDTYGSSGVPFLQKVPLLGMAFSSKTVSRERTEMVVFLTPRVIYDSNELTDASEELISKLKRVQKMIR